jgi:hypothetical protein
MSIRRAAPLVVLLAALALAAPASALTIGIADQKPTCSRIRASWPMASISRGARCHGTR